jgi:GT2 family glycosyltransferase
MYFAVVMEKDIIKTLTDTAVVILSYNGSKLHADFLPLIVSESYGKYDVIVVDNASTDDTYQYVSENFPDVQLLRIPVNRGFTNGYIEGLSRIEAKYYVLLSADFEVTHGWFEPLYNLIVSDDKIAAVQPKIRYQKDKKMFEYAGASGAYLDALGYPFCRGRIFFDIEEDLGQYDDICEVFWASGGCCMVRAELYHTYGGLDDDFFAHMEEIDLCWRLKNNGYKIMVCPQSTVYHVGGSVISYGSPQKVFRNYRNGLILLVKNLPLSELLWKLPLRWNLDVIAAYRALFCGKSGEFFAIMKAHLSFLFGIVHWFSKRKESRAGIHSPNLKGIYPGSIVWQYFFKKRKKFTSLNWNTD